MNALKINFGGERRVSIDWNSSVSGLSALAQRAGVSVMTQAGSDKFLPERGTDVAQTLFSYGAFDSLGIQHVLNFGALKARDDMRAYETQARSRADSIERIKLQLLDVRNNAAEVSVQAINLNGESTYEILAIP
jgi:hypothetical protein